MKSSLLSSASHEILTFRNSIEYIVGIHFFYGIDIRKCRKFHFICNILYAIHLIYAILFLIYASLKADLPNENMQIFVWSAGMLTLSIANVIMKISYRWTNEYLVKNLDKTDKMLGMLSTDVECQKFLKTLKFMSKFIMVFPLSFVAIQVSRQIEIYCFSERTVINYGSATFRYLQERFYIDDIFRIAIAGPCYIFFLNGTIVALPMSVTLMFMIGRLKRMNDVYYFIKFHRQLCNYYKLIQNAFGLFFFWACGTILAVILFFARTVATSPENISWSAVLLLTIYLPLLCSHIIIIGMLNIQLEMTLSHLMKNARKMQLKSIKLGSIKKANLHEKLELYLTFVVIDDPFIKLIGVGKVKPNVVLGILGFVLCYTCVLYDK